MLPDFICEEIETNFPISFLFPDDIQNQQRQRHKHTHTTHTQTKFAQRVINCIYNPFKLSTKDLKTTKNSEERKLLS